MPASELIEVMADLLTEFVPRLTGQGRLEAEELLVRLREPVRVAVVGPVKAGKSTMVNALLGQRVAPTDVSECTQVVTWFRYGEPERVELVSTDGSVTQLQLTAEGTLPAVLGVPLEGVSHLRAYIANKALEDVIIIDTPGIGSVHAELSMSTRRLLAVSEGTSVVTGKADAVLLLLDQVMRSDGLEALGLVRSEAGGLRSAANTLGLLSRVDKLGDGDQDPWQVALELAETYAGRFRAELSTVVPVVGLVAETAETATLTESDARHLEILASLDPDDFAALLWTVDRFGGEGNPLPAEARSRLLAILDLYGVERAVNFIRSGNQGATAIRHNLSAISGITEVKRVLRAFFQDKDHILKVRSALDVTARITYRTEDGVDPGVMPALRSRLEALRLDPVMHPVAELEAWHDCSTGRVILPDEHLLDLERMVASDTLALRLGVAGDDHDAMRGAAQAGMGRWRTYMVTDATPAQAAVARVILRSYQLAWQSLQDPSDQPGLAP